MSTPQRIHVPTTIVVDRATADVLRLEAKNIAMFEHDSFEDLLDLSPDAQYGLSLRYRDIFNILDILSWNPDTTDPTIETYTVPLTDDLTNRLALRRYDLAMNTADILPDDTRPIPPETLTEITTNRHAGQALDHLFHTYNNTTGTP
jgi:hypothetical protein